MPSWDGIIDPRLNVSEAPPSSGFPFRVVEVRDLRAFRLGVGDPWAHTLREGAPEDRALTSRVIGRRRALARPSIDQRARGGNLLLPEDRSVALLVAEAVTEGFRQAGRRVVDPAQAPERGERPVHVEVEGFWGRMKTGVGFPRFQTWIRIRVRAPETLLAAGGSVCAAASLASPSPSAGVWRRSYESALAHLAERVARAIRLGTRPYCVSP